MLLTTSISPMYERPGTDCSHVFVVFAPQQTLGQMASTQN